jgi:hypothetical protein
LLGFALFIYLLLSSKHNWEEQPGFKVTACELLLTRADHILKCAASTAAKVSGYFFVGSN